MDTIIYKNDKNFPPLLHHINDPPEKLYVRGNIERLLDPTIKVLCVVGSRKYSGYGKEACEKLLEHLVGYNVCIVSGLALGIDSIAHRKALDLGLYTIAFPGSGLDRSVMYPQTHLGLSEEIVAAGGALLSELEPKTMGAPWTFPKRNRLLAGISHGTLIVEAEKISGTLITSKYALGYDRDVAVVPGSIFSSLTAGPHMLLTRGAMPITCGDDLLEFLGFARKDDTESGQISLDFKNKKIEELGEIEKKIIHLLQIEARSKDALVREIGISVQILNTIISFLEIEGYIKEEMGVVKLA